MTTPTLPGPYTFFDAIGGPGQRIEVLHDGDELVARFPAADGDAGADIAIADMAGRFEAMERR